MKRTLLLPLFLVVPVACGESKTESAPTAEATKAEAERKAAEAAAIAAENSAPVAPKPKKPSKFEATVDLTFTGAIDKTFEGPVGVCGATFIDGKLQGGNYGVSTDELEFQVLALSDEELARPAVILNLKGENRTSFLGRKGEGVTIDVARGATIDAELRDMASDKKVQVKGTITCGPDYRTR